MPRPLSPDIGVHEIAFLRLAYACNASELRSLAGFDGKIWKLCTELRSRLRTPTAFLEHPLVKRLWCNRDNAARALDLEKSALDVACGPSGLERVASFATPVASPPGVARECEPTGDWAEWDDWEHVASPGETGTDGVAQAESDTLERATCWSTMRGMREGSSPVGTETVDPGGEEGDDTVVDGIVARVREMSTASRLELLRILR